MILNSSHIFYGPNVFLSQELELIVFKIGVIEATKDVADAEALRNTLALLELLLVERDVVVSCNILQWLQKVAFNVLFALLLFYHNCALEIQVILFFEYVKQRWVSTSIDSNLLELVSEVILDGLFFKTASLQDDVVLAFEYKAVDDKVLSLEQVRLLQEAHNFFSVDIIIAFLDIHCHEVQIGLSNLLPFLLELFVLLHDIIVVEHSETELMLEHLGLEILEHHVSQA